MAFRLGLVFFSSGGFAVFLFGFWLWLWFFGFGRFFLSFEKASEPVSEEFSEQFF